MKCKWATLLAQHFPLTQNLRPIHTFACTSKKSRSCLVPCHRSTSHKRRTLHELTTRLKNPLETLKDETLSQFLTLDGLLERAAATGAPNWTPFQTAPRVLLSQSASLPLGAPCATTPPLSLSPSPSPSPPPVLRLPPFRSATALCQRMAT